MNFKCIQCETGAVAHSHLVCLSCVTSNTSAPNTTPATQGALVIIARITIPVSIFSTLRVLHKDVSIGVHICEIIVAMYVYHPNPNIE